MVATSNYGPWKVTRAYMIMVSSLQPKVPKEIPSAQILGSDRSCPHPAIFLLPTLLIKLPFVESSLMELTAKLHLPT